MNEIKLRSFKQNNIDYEIYHIDEIKELIKLCREVLHESKNYNLIYNGLDTAIVKIEELILYDMVAKTAIFESDKPIKLSHTTTKLLQKVN